MFHFFLSIVSKLLIILLKGSKSTHCYWKLPIIDKNSIKARGWRPLQELEESLRSVPYLLVVYQGFFPTYMDWYHGQGLIKKCQYLGTHMPFKRTQFLMGLVMFWWSVPSVVHGHGVPSCGPYYPNCGKFKEAFCNPALSRLYFSATASLQACKVIIDSIV